VWADSDVLNQACAPQTWLVTGTVDDSPAAQHQGSPVPLERLVVMLGLVCGHSRVQHTLTGSISTRVLIWVGCVPAAAD
jgi:hypothetical protein